MTQKSFAVALSKQLYLIQLVCISSIGIVLATYTTDNLIESLFGRTWAVQLIPDAQVLTEINSGTQPFVSNFFCLSLGLLVVFCLSLVIFALDPEKD
jgi:hypothetical protein